MCYFLGDLSFDTPSPLRKCISFYTYINPLRKTHSKNVISKNYLHHLFKCMCINVQVQTGSVLLKEPPPSNVASYHISIPITHQTESRNSQSFSQNTTGRALALSNQQWTFSPQRWSLPQPVWSQRSEMWAAWSLAPAALLCSSAAAMLLLHADVGITLTGCSPWALTALTPQGLREVRRL